MPRRGQHLPGAAHLHGPAALQDHDGAPSWRARSRSCVMTTAQPPRAAGPADRRWRAGAMRRRGPWWVRPPAGCARRPASAIAAAARCAMPPESCQACCRAAAPRPAACSCARAAARARSGASPRTSACTSANCGAMGMSGLSACAGSCGSSASVRPQSGRRAGPSSRPAGAARDGDAAAGAQGRRQLAHHGLGQQRFARAAFADEAQRLAGGAA